MCPFSRNINILNCVNMQSFVGEIPPFTSQESKIAYSWGIQHRVDINA